MLKEIQEQVDRWIANIGKRYFSELTNMALLTEEVGELARVIARVYGDQKPKQGDLKADAKEQMAEELADIIWVVACIANQTGIDLNDAFAKSLHKKSTRDLNRFSE